jgi:hypothetical protein
MMGSCLSCCQNSLSKKSSNPEKPTKSSSDHFGTIEESRHVFDDEASAYASAPVADFSKKDFL